MGQYTKSVEQSFFDEDGNIKELRDADENESIDTIKNRLEKLRKEFILSPAYFLVSRYIEPKADEMENEKYLYKIEKGLLGNTEDEEIIFRQIKMDGIGKLEEEEKIKYIKILKSIILQNNPYESLNEWDCILNKIFMMENKIINRDEALKIAHALQFSYEMAQNFLLRVLDDDGLSYNKADDLVEIFCFLHNESNSYQKANELKKDYHSQSQNIEKILFSEKQENGTINMNNDLRNCIEEWEKDKSSKSPEEKFKEWLLLNSKYLDIPSKSAYVNYRNLIGLLYAKWFPEKFSMIFQYTISFPKDKGIDYILLTKTKELKTISYTIEIAKRIANDIIDFVNSNFADKVSQSQKNKAVLGYAAVNINGELSFENLSDRIIAILIEEESVKKADILLLLWLCILAFKNENMGTTEIFESFWNQAEDILDKSNLPKFYVPHLLEHTFLISIANGGEDVEYILKEYADILKIGRKDPRGRERKEEIHSEDCNKGIRNARERLARQAKSMNDLGEIGSKLESHFLLHYAEKGSYWFQQDGIYYKAQHTGAYQNALEKVCDYENIEIQEKFDDRRGDYKEENAYQDRYKFITSVGNYLSQSLRQKTSYLCNFRKTCKRIPKSGTYIAVESQSFRKKLLAGTENKILEHFMNDMQNSKKYVFHEDGIYFNEELVCKYENGKLELFQPTSEDYTDEKARKKRKEAIKEIAEYLIPALEKQNPNTIVGFSIKDGIFQDIVFNEISFPHLLILTKGTKDKKILEHYKTNFEEIPNIEYIFTGNNIHLNNGDSICKYDVEDELFKNNIYYFNQKKEREKVLNSIKDYLEKELGNSIRKYRFKISIYTGGTKTNASYRPSKICIVAEKEESI